MIFLLLKYSVFLIYVYVGFHAYRADPRGKRNKLFLLLCFLLAYCSLMEVIRVNYVDPVTVYLIDRISQIG